MRSKQRDHGRRKASRQGLAALEVVITTVFTMVIFATLTFTAMKILRLIFSVAGQMTGTPLM